MTGSAAPDAATGDKKADKKAARADKKAQRKAAAADPTATLAANVNDVTVDVSEGKYGCYGIMRSQSRVEGRVLRKLPEVSSLPEGTQVWIRGRLHTSRAKGKQCFLVLRQSDLNIQCLLSVSESISKQMVKFVANITKESVVDVEGVVKSVPTPIEGCIIKDREVLVTQVFVVSASAARLPLQLEDASRPESKEGDLEDGISIRVNQDTRLDNRILDLRTPANQAIFRLEAGVCELFRKSLTDRGFVEIHTPKVGEAGGGSKSSRLPIRHSRRRSSRLRVKVAPTCSRFLTSRDPRTWLSRRSCTSRWPSPVTSIESTPLALSFELRTPTRIVT